VAVAVAAAIPRQGSPSPRLLCTVRLSPTVARGPALCSGIDGRGTYAEALHVLGGCGATRTAVYVCRACTCIHGHMLYLPRVRCPAAATSAVCGVREKYTARFHYLLAAALAHSAGPRFPASRADRSRDYLCIYLCRYASICVDTQSESWANSPTVEGPRHPSPIPAPPPHTHRHARERTSRFQPRDSDHVGPRASRRRAMYLSGSSIEHSIHLHTYLQRYNMYICTVCTTDTLGAGYTHR